MSNIVNTKNRATKDKVNASLILGIMSIVFVIVNSLGLILGIVGLVVGIIELRGIKQLKLDGKGSTILGIVCSSFGILLTITLATFFGYGSY